MNAFSRHPREGGSVLILVVILALVLIGLVGLAMDGAWVLNTSQQLRHAADAAALNAARYVKTDVEPYDALRAAAMNVALANDAAKSDVNLDANAGNDPAGDIVVGFWDWPTR
ncbi:MAG TPA: pilus assembly protein TadG-related protein, partial [Planctomycetota bacterium]|nr:pilus assembly protein TadG-related protein [Planctomycetota bacterium]